MRKRTGSVFKHRSGHLVLRGATVEEDILIHPPPRSAAISRDTRFPLVAKSQPMRQLIERVKAAMQDRRAVPLIVGPNTIELRAFLRRVAKDAGIPEEQVYLKRDRQPLLDDRMLFGDAKIVVITDGDNVSQAIQVSWSAGELSQRVALLLLVVSRETSALVGDPGSPWIETFLRQCTQTMRWPSLRERRADRADLINAMLRRIGSDGPRGIPIFHPNVVDLLSSTPFEGTEDVIAMLQRGYQRYCAEEALQCTARHLIGEELQAAVTTSQRPTVVPTA